MEIVDVSYETQEQELRELERAVDNINEVAYSTIYPQYSDVVRRAEQHALIKSGWKNGRVNRDTTKIDALYSNGRCD